MSKAGLEKGEFLDLAAGPFGLKLASTNLSLNSPLPSIYYYASTTQIWTHSTRKVEDLPSSTGTRSASGREDFCNQTTFASYFQDLTLYFQSLSVSSLPAVPGSSSDINISNLVTSLSHVQRSLTQHLDTHKIQSQLDSWLQRSS